MCIYIFQEKYFGSITLQPKYIHLKKNILGLRHCASSQPSAKLDINKMGISSDLDIFYGADTFRRVWNMERVLAVAGNQYITHLRTLFATFNCHNGSMASS